MIKVTGQMLYAVYEYMEGEYEDDELVKRIIELHEANKQHLVTKDAMTNCVHVLPMDFVKDLSNGTQNLKHLSERERDAIVRCIANAVVESCNPTQEPLSEHEVNNIVFNLSKGSTLFDFARLVEQAHGIGTPQTTT